jgi:hypothetical protein
LPKNDGKKEREMEKPEQHTTDRTYVAIPGSERVALPGAQALGPANPHARLEVLIKLRGKKKLPEISTRS